MKKSFKIPMLPPSINQTYKINYNTRQVYKAKEVRDFETQCKLFTPMISPSSASPLKTTIELHGNWWTKNKTVKRKDIQNMDKALVDAIFSKLGIDDSLIFEHKLVKVQNKEEYVIITLESLDEYLRPS